MNRLVRFGAEALKPQKVGPHRWHTPMVSRRKANVLRKKALRDGSFGSVVTDPETGRATAGWDPAWDIFETPAAPRALMPQKLHKNQRNRAKRAEKITMKLGEQESRIKDLNRVKAVPKPTPDEGTLSLLRWLKISGAPKKR